MVTIVYSGTEPARATGAKRAINRAKMHPNTDSILYAQRNAYDSVKNEFSDGRKPFRQTHFAGSARIPARTTLYFELPNHAHCRDFCDTLQAGLQGFGALGIRVTRHRDTYLTVTMNVGNPNAVPTLENAIRNALGKTPKISAYFRDAA